MSELFIELFSEEMPPKLQINARRQLEKLLNQNLSSLNLKYKNLSIYSTPTRLVALVSSLPNKIKIPTIEAKGPKESVTDDVVENFAKSKKVNIDNLYKKKLEKGIFYFAKIKGREINTGDELARCIPKFLNEISWKKSMKWSNHELNWGRPLRSILAIFDKKPLKFNFAHLKTVNFTLIEEHGEIKQKIIKEFDEYHKFLKGNGIIVDHIERAKFISQKIYSICKSKSYKEFIDESLLSEVTNLVDKPQVIVAKFDKNYLKLPKEIIKSTLQSHQRYFTLFDDKDRMSNEFVIVTNNKDDKKLIKAGNERVVEARLSDANFFGRGINL